LETAFLRYYDHKNKGVDIKGFLEDVESIEDE
jgi:hypothetical protein